jgi:hypothetical protein
LNSGITDKIWMCTLRTLKGRAIAQAVSRWLSIAAARVRARAWSSGICGGQSCTGAGLLRVLRFPLPILIRPTAPLSSPIIRGWYSRSVVADVRSGLSLTPLQTTEKLLLQFPVHCSLASYHLTLYVVLLPNIVVKW